MASGREESSMSSDKSLIEDKIRVQPSKLQQLASCKLSTAADTRPLNKLDDRRATCFSSIDSGCGAGATATITTNLNYDYSLDADGSCDCSMADDKCLTPSQASRTACANKLSGPQAMVVRSATDKMLILSRQQQKQQDELDHSHKSAKPLVSSSMSSSSGSSSSAGRTKSSNDQCRIVLTKSSDCHHDSQRARERSTPPDDACHLHSASACRVLPREKPLKKRENWDRNIEFLLAVIGFAVDLGNVWRFPYICYKNGGGAFLIPYTIMFILGGLPIFYLEMSLGQLFSSGCLTVWRRVCPMFKGIGYAMCVLNFFTGLYYNTIISWAVYFFVQSFTLNALPWTSCNNTWNEPDCKTISERKAQRGIWIPATGPDNIVPATYNSTLNTHSPTRDYFDREVLHVHLSTGIDDLGSIRGPLAAYLAIVFICIYFAIWKGVKSTGKAVWITALLPYFVLIPLLIRGIFLEGSWVGIKYYLMPEWDKILDVNVWVEAAKQIYFSLGPGFGTLMALSSYNKFNHNCQRDALIAASVNYFASFISGFVVFAVLGYMSSFLEVDVAEVAAEGPGLVFQVYPEGLALMSFSAVWSVLFFLMVITLGIDSTFGGLESVITGLCDEYPRTLRAHRGIFIGFLIVIIYLCSLPTTTYGGHYVIVLLESYGTAVSLLFIVLCEVVVVCWIYGTDRFCTDLTGMSGKRPGLYWRICWKYISPSLSILIFLAACMQEWNKFYILQDGDYTYPGWAPKLGLLMTGASVCCVPTYIVYYYCTQTSGSFIERMRKGCFVADNDRHDEERYTDALPVDKIRDHNDIHLDTDI